MKLGHFPDLHLEAAFAWMGSRDVEAPRRRRQGLRATLKRIAQLAVDERADALLCGGDLYEHEHFTPDTVEFVRSVFGDLHPLPVFLAPGNHDWLGPESLYRQATWSPNVHVFSHDRLEPIEVTEGLTLWGGAHVVPANSDNFLDGFSVNRGGVWTGRTDVVAPPSAAPEVRLTSSGLKRAGCRSSWPPPSRRLPTRAVLTARHQEAPPSPR